MISSTIKLFNAIQISKNKINAPFNINILNKTMRHGFILDPNIDSRPEIVDEIISIIGVNGRYLNESFHKSWGKVRYEKIEVLVLEQLIHYFTTYGYEKLGIFSSDLVFIPNEALDVPNIEGTKFNFLYIRGLTKTEILEKIIELGSGIALKEDTINMIMDIIMDMGYNPHFFVEKIGNRELKIRLYNHYDIVPTDPVDYLRYVIYNITGDTLLIKDNNLINRIKYADYSDLNNLLKKAPDNLASIFFRYKPLFLAMKHVSIGNGRNTSMSYAFKDIYLPEANNIKPFINKLRKKANKQHRPMPVDYFNSITEQISKNELNIFDFKKRLKNINIYRKIRLAYSLNYRVGDSRSIVYRIRNGKSWATELDIIANKSLAIKVLSILKDSIAFDISKNVKGKRIYIPDYINYSLPSTEKNFIGNIPSNSYVSLHGDMIVGVHWFNQHNNRVDLDLSMTGAFKIGWDGRYRRGSDLLFSGDVTDAPLPNGASELFYINSDKGDNGLYSLKNEPWVLNLNNYTHHDLSPDESITFKFFIGNKKIKELKNNYMIDPNDVILQTNMMMSDSQQVLGLVVNFDKNDNRFYFSNFSSGNSITSRCNTPSSVHVKNYLIANACSNTINIKDILLQAEAILTDSAEDCDINLSPELLDKTSFINILK